MTVHPENQQEERGPADDPQYRRLALLLNRIGTAELTRKMIDAAPAVATPEPQITQRRPEYARPASNLVWSR